MMFYIVLFIVALAYSVKQKGVLMCGIFGGIGYILSEKIKMLMVYNESRGGHAAGFWNPEQGVVKMAKKTPEFLEEVGYKMLDSSIYLGHTRFGTHGLNVDENAHPFQRNNTILIHNGVLSNHTDLAKTYGFNWTVDSEALVEMVARQGYTGIEEVRGSIACAWTDGDGTLHLYKRDNPLFIGTIFYSDGAKGTYFSSLEPSLKSLGCREIKPLSGDNYYQINDQGDILKQIKLKVPVYSPDYTTKKWDDYKPDKTHVGKIRLQDNWDDTYEGYNDGFWSLVNGKNIWVTNHESETKSCERPVKLLGEKTTPEVKDILDVEEEWEDELLLIDRDTLNDIGVLMLQSWSKLNEVKDWDASIPELMDEIESMLHEISSVEDNVVV